MSQTPARDIVSSLVILIGGLLMMWEVARSMSIWSAGEPQAGFFPMVIALAIVALSAAIAAGAARRLHRRLPLAAVPSPVADDSPNSHDYRVSGLAKVGIYLGSMLAYALLLERLGFVVSSLAFVLAMLILVERQPIKTGIATTATAVIAAYLVFVRILAVPLPSLGFGPM